MTEAQIKERAKALGWTVKKFKAEYAKGYFTEMRKAGLTDEQILTEMKKTEDQHQKKKRK
jgi:hypothetical protein